MSQNFTDIPNTPFTFIDKKEETHHQATSQQKISNLISHLNSQQQEASLHKNGPMLIVAGAGSGKTGVLTHRIAVLLLSGVKPWNILALTFTNKAAREMLERIGNLVNPEDAEKIWAGTFHSVFAKILRIEATAIGYSSDFTIYDTDDSLSAIKTLMTNNGISTTATKPQSVRSAISSAKNKMISPDEFFKTAFSPESKQIAFLYKEYEKYLSKCNAMDFDDLLLNFIKLLEKDSVILKKYQDKFKYILVDEYQDTNKAQYIATSLLAKAHQNICVVGDDAQSIYGWRGADINNILNFQEDYPYCKIIRLEQNYRSTKTILDAADSVIKQNKKRIDKTLWTNKENGFRVNVEGFGDDKKEAEEIAKRIESIAKNGTPLKEIAVLYRTNAQALAIESALSNSRVKYVVYGGMSFFRRKEIRDTIAYLRVIVNQSDNESLLRILNEPTRGIGQTSISHLLNYAFKYNISLFEAFENADRNGKLQARAVIAAQNFVELIKNYTNQETLTNPHLITEYIENTGLLAMYEEMGTEDAKDKGRNIEQFLSDIQTYLTSNPNNTLAEYLQQVSLITDQDTKEGNKEHISVMTLHSAKGLEFEQVFIAGLEQHLFPLLRSDSTPEDLEEERRLFYVGITRAKVRLFLSFAKQRLKFGEIKPQIPSQFLKEVTPELLNWANREKDLNKNLGIHSSYSNSFNRNKPSFFSNHGNRDSYSQGESYNEYSQLPSETSNANFSFKINDVVNHPSFGRGVVTGLVGAGEQKKVYVRFDLHGKKVLMLKFAKLTKG